MCAGTPSLNGVTDWRQGDHDGENGAAAGSSGSPRDGPRDLCDRPGGTGPDPGQHLGSEWHSATAVMSTTKKVYAWQFSYADAHLAESIRIGVTCKVYWGINP